MLKNYSLAPVSRLYDFDRMFDGLFDFYSVPSLAKSYGTHKDGVGTYTFEVPGFAKEDLKVSVEGNALVISGKKDERTVSYSVKLPSSADVSTASAECKDGLLLVKIKDKETRSSKREIEIR